MDILTPKGQLTVAQEQRAAQLFEERFPGCRYVCTPKDKPAVVDALIVRGNAVIAAAETKCRVITLEQFTEWGKEWLVTFDKVVQARQFAMGCGVPLIGLLYLVPQDHLLVQRLFNDDGSPATDFSVSTTRTQRTVNGGKVSRANAFLKMNC